MIDVFTAMTIERREQPEPSFLNFMIGLAKAEAAQPSSFMDATNKMVVANREMPSMIDAFTAMTIERREQELEQPSMIDAFTAMTIERREQEQKEPQSGFLDFMVGLAKADAAKPKSFMDATNKMIVANREKPSMVDAFTAMTLERRLAKNEPKKLFEKGLPHAMAMMAVKQHEASQTVNHQKEITFLNDVFHPDSIYELF